MAASIPYGKVMSYGQIAYMCGNVRAARIVGGIAHNGPRDIAWHRVVKHDGRLAEGYPGGVAAQELLLQSEDIKIINGSVPMDIYQWHHH